jgi:hypothetical protein
LIDSFVSAEIPDPVEDPLGYALVAEFMMHGPCGKDKPKCPCMKDGLYALVVYDTFKDACVARGLLGDDSEWYCAFDEALKWGMGHQLRQLFVTMIIFYGVLDENCFFEKYWTYLAEDIQHRIRCSLHDASYIVPPDELKNMLLDELSALF